MLFIVHIFGCSRFIWFIEGEKWSIMSSPEKMFLSLAIFWGQSQFVSTILWSICGVFLIDIGWSKLRSDFSYRRSWNCEWGTEHNTTVWAIYTGRVFCVKTSWVKFLTGPWELDLNSTDQKKKISSVSFTKELLF